MSARRAVGHPRGERVLPGEPLTQTNAGWLLSQTLCYLGHLELGGRVAREPDGQAERWQLA
jgi:hypothetical protein